MDCDDSTSHVTMDVFKTRLVTLLSISYRVRLDLTNLYTDFVSFHHLCLFLLVEVFLLSLTLFIHPCFKVGILFYHRLWLGCVHFMCNLLSQLWHSLYNWSSGSSGSRRTVNVVFVLFYALYVLGSASIVCWVIYSHSFPTFPTIAASVEQVHN